MKMGAQPLGAVKFDNLAIGRKLSENAEAYADTLNFSLALIMRDSPTGWMEIRLN